MDNNLIVNYLRYTSCLEIEKANSGHPGVALGGAPIVFSIFKNMFFNPKDATYINRDRVVFSAGHASSLIYACMNMFGYDITVDDLKSFRQLKSKTSGHPEIELAGIDASTGPLGEGVAMAVGLALAESHLNKVYQVGEYSPINHHTFCFCGDGCLMEGVAQEAITIAGNLKLNKLILLYDKNDITIEGSTTLSNMENVEQKFLSCNWNVIKVEDGNQVEQIDKAIIKAKNSDKPTIIICKTQIGYGSDLAGKNTVHGKPLNRQQLDILRQNLDYFVPDWEIPNQVKKEIDKLLLIKKDEYNKQIKLLEKYKRVNNKYYDNLVNGYCNCNLLDLVNEHKDSQIDLRKVGHKIINQLFDSNLIGGSADLAPSTLMYFENCGYFDSKNRQNKNIAYGIREHVMGAISNGIALHGGLRSFCSTFFSFCNFLSPAIRLSALMKVPVLYYFTHDSIATGEDGPTHQPVEQIATLRAMPDINVFRPCGQNEMLAGFSDFINNSRPVVLVVAKQVLQSVPDDFKKAEKGGYVIKEVKDFDATIVATGSDVNTCFEVSKNLEKYGINTRVVSMPCTELFDKQSNKYKQSVLDSSKPIICVESSSDNIWYKYTNCNDYVIKLDRFGLSGKSKEVVDYLGFSVEKLTKKILKLLSHNKK